MFLASPNTDVCVKYGEHEILHTDVQDVKPYFFTSYKSSQPKIEISYLKELFKLLDWHPRYEEPGYRIILGVKHCPVGQV